jgi:hypothetical protein
MQVVLDVVVVSEQPPQQRAHRVLMRDEELSGEN